jgi:excisionase family DNA binding protein
MIDNYYTTRDAAKVLGISLRTAQQWLEKGYLKGWKTSGGHRRILRSSVSKLLAARTPVALAPPEPQSLQVLVVEDNEALLKLYRLQIARWKLPVLLYTAANGYEALVMVGKVAPDLLICDLRLPGVTGFQVVRALCDMERYSQLAIVVVSALPSEEIDAHGSLPARVHQMGKPIDFQRLEQIAQARWALQTDAAAR